MPMQHNGKKARISAFNIIMQLTLMLDTVNKEIL
jgi:hypothetical protein